MSKNERMIRANYLLRFCARFASSTLILSLGASVAETMSRLRIDENSMVTGGGEELNNKKKNQNWI